MPQTPGSALILWLWVVYVSLAHTARSKYRQSSLPCFLWLSQHNWAKGGIKRSQPRRILSLNTPGYLAKATQILLPIYIFVLNTTPKGLWSNPESKGKADPPRPWLWQTPRRHLRAPEFISSKKYKSQGKGIAWNRPTAPSEALWNLLAAN